MKTHALTVFLAHLIKCMVQLINVLTVVSGGTMGIPVQNLFKIAKFVLKKPIKAKKVQQVANNALRH